MRRYKSGSQKTKPEVLCSRGTFGNVAVIPNSRRAPASAGAFPLVKGRNSRDFWACG